MPGGLRCDVLFRHVTHTQVVMPLDVTAVVVVAPAGVAMRSPDDMDQVRAFVLDALSADRPAPGDMALGAVPDRGAESVELFNVQGLRYPRTTTASTWPHWVAGRRLIG